MNRTKKKLPHKLKLKGKKSVTYQSGNTYIGEEKDGLKHGYGVYTTREKGSNKLQRVFEGNWVWNRLYGQGKITAFNGSVWKGNFKDGKLDGYGTFRSRFNDVTYDGEYKDDKKEGYGKYTDKRNGIIYEGNFKNGRYDGHGEYIDKKKKRRYIGEWRDGQKNGNGTLTDLKNNFIYSGEWINGKYHGRGTNLVPNSYPEQRDYFENNPVGPSTRLPTQLVSPPISFSSPVTDDSDIGGVKTKRKRHKSHKKSKQKLHSRRRQKIKKKKSRNH